MASAVAAVGTFVASAVGGALGSSTVAAGIAAVAGTVAEGVVVGAVIGGATAAIQGESILKGALHGAVAGGITAGVASTAGIITNTWSAADQLEGMNLIQNSSGELISNTSSEGALGGEGMLKSLENTPGTNIETNYIPVGNTPATSAASQGQQSVGQKQTGLLSSFSDSEKAHILGGVAQGGLKAVGSLGTAMFNQKGQEATLDKQQKIKEAQLKASIPSLYKTQTQNTQLKTPDWWGSSINAANQIIKNNPYVGNGINLNPVA